MDFFECHLINFIKVAREVWRVSNASQELKVGFVQMPPFSVTRYNVQTEGTERGSEMLTALLILGYSMKSLRINLQDARWLQTGSRGRVPNDRLPNTFMTVTHDFYGRKADLHEKDKQRFARRMVRYKHGLIHTKKKP